MAQNYECALLLQPALSDDEVKTYLDRFSNEITSREGEVVHTQVWGKRSLEYPIKRQTDAIFAFLYFRMETAGDMVAEFERQVRINDDLLREMTIKVPELNILNAPGGESRFSESYRLNHGGNRRGGGGPRRDYRSGGDSRSSSGPASAPAADKAKPAEAPAEQAPAENAESAPTPAPEAE